MSRPGIAHFYLILANLIYGANYSIAKIALLEYLKPFGFIFIRCVFATFLFWVTHSLFIKEKIERRDFGRLALCGLFGVAINQLMFFKGLSITTEINAALIMITTPIIVLVVSNLVLKEKITLMKSLGILAGASGVLILLLQGRTGELSSSGLLGDIFVLINATSYGLYLVLVKPLMSKYHPLTIVKWIFLFGLIIVIPFGLGEFKEVQWETLPVRVWASVFYVVICTTFFAYLLNTLALRTVNPSLVSTYIYTQPLIASFIAISIGNDFFTALKLLAALLIFTGVYLVSKQTKSKYSIS